MKKISYLFFLIFLASILGTSCSKTKTYAQLLNEEKDLIAGFVKKNNILVISGTPNDSTLWNKNGQDIYMLTPTGLYFHMVNPGNLTDSITLEYKNLVVPRFIQYTLGLPADTISNWTTVDFDYTSDFTYGDLTQSCKAFQEAASYLKRLDSEAKLIVPSKLGFNAEMMSVTPLGYDFKIKFQR